MLSLLLAAVSGDVLESKTGIKFPEKSGGGKLQRLGVRYKGPIKVYAVGEYSDGTYMLKMSYGVGSKKMTSALAEALKPRCSDGKAIEEFEDCLAKGLPNGAPKGTNMEFATGGGSLGVSVNGKRVGAVGSKLLSSAFANIYSDGNAVCSMNAVGADGEVADSSGRSCITPLKGAVVGAAIGYGVGKKLS
jgi:hypothetical protein